MYKLLHSLSINNRYHCHYFIPELCKYQQTHTYLGINHRYMLFQLHYQYVAMMQDSQRLLSQLELTIWNHMDTTYYCEKKTHLIRHHSKHVHFHNTAWDRICNDYQIMLFHRYIKIASWPWNSKCRRVHIIVQPARTTAHFMIQTTDYSFSLTKKITVINSTELCRCSLTAWPFSLAQTPMYCEETHNGYFEIALHITRL